MTVGRWKLKSRQTEPVPSSVSGFLVSTFYWWDTTNIHMKHSSYDPYSSEVTHLRFSDPSTATVPLFELNALIIVLVPMETGKKCLHSPKVHSWRLGSVNSCLICPAYMHVLSRDVHDQLLACILHQRCCNAHTVGSTERPSDPVFQIFQCKMTWGASVR